MIDYSKQMQEAAQAFADSLKSVMPRVSVNKNGYEIRSHVLEMAQMQVWQDFHAKWGQFETSVTKEGSQFVTKVEMPEIPSADKVLEAAEKFYNFVNGKVDK